MHIPKNGAFNLAHTALSAANANIALAQRCFLALEPPIGHEAHEQWIELIQAFELVEFSIQQFQNRHTPNELSNYIDSLTK